MKAFLDTSVLVAAFYEDHEHHDSCLKLLAALTPKTGSTGAHCLAELYSTLTGMPGKRRTSGEHALLFIDSVRERLRIVGLDAEEYRDALASFPAAGVAGGAVFDALILQCARKIRAEVVYTLNLKDFRRMGSSMAERIQSPDT